MNQVQFSPFEYRRALLDAARVRGVSIEAYSPLGTGRHLSDRTVGRIAEHTGHTPAQVLLRWCLQKALIVSAFRKIPGIFICGLSVGSAQRSTA